MNTVLFVNATIGFSENLFLVYFCGYILSEELEEAKLPGMNIDQPSCKFCVTDTTFKFVFSFSQLMKLLDKKDMDLLCLNYYLLKVAAHFTKGIPSPSTTTELHRADIENLYCGTLLELCH